MLLPVAGTVLWWGLIPVGAATGGFSEKWVWVFILNPASCAFASYLLISLFLTALDEDRPWRPLKCYLPIMTVVYIVQVCHDTPNTPACRATRLLPASLLKRPCCRSSCHVPLLACAWKCMTGQQTRASCAPHLMPA